ncbi:MAG: DoxX family protein [Firmicutes bacterium]|nr:DoxX family protein [Bacillota bacterium]
MDWLWLVGRVLFGVYFIFSGLNHFLQLPTMIGYSKYKGVPAPGFLVPLTGLMLILGGLSILTGIMVTWGLALLVLFLVPTTLIMHRYWNIEDPTAKMGEMVNFLKNLALVGATLMLLAISDWSWTF